MPNPNELYRIEEEEMQSIEERNRQYKREADSKRLIFLRGALQSGYRPKSEKEAILGEIRELEVALGLWSEPYNGSVTSDRVDVV